MKIKSERSKISDDQFLRFEREHSSSRHAHQKPPLSPLRKTGSLLSQNSTQYFGMPPPSSTSQLNSLNLRTSDQRLKTKFALEKPQSINRSTYFTQRGVSEQAKDNFVKAAQSANRFYLKNMTAALDMYKDHLRHTARLHEIKHKKTRTGQTNDFTTSRLSARSSQSNKSSASSMHDLCRPKVFKRKEVSRQILKRNEQIFIRLQEIHGVSTICLIQDQKKNRRTNSNHSQRSTGSNQSGGSYSFRYRQQEQ